MNTDRAVVTEIREKGKKLHEKIIEFWEVASNGDLNDLKKHSVIVKSLCEKNSSLPHAADYIQLINAIEAFFESKCAEAKDNFLAVLPPNVEWENKEIEAMARLFCGGNYRSLGQFDEALFHLLEVPRLINPQGAYARHALLAYYFLGELHISLNEHKSAENYFLEGLSFGHDGIELSARFRLYSGLGNLYLNRKEHDKCEQYFTLAINAARPGSQLARAWYDMALYYEMAGRLDEALDYCKRSFDLRIESNLMDAATTSQLLLGRLLMKKGDYDKAITIFEESLTATKKFSAIVKTQSVYKSLADCYEKQGYWEAAFHNFKKYEEIKSTIFSEQQTRFFKIKNEEISKQKEVIELFHTELKDSIRYARRIQQTILPPEKLLHQALPQSFLFYKPKDVVSGDFYWLEVLQSKGNNTGNLTLFAVADCTGHGVPGAMVSMICFNALNRSVREFELTEPAAILNKAREILFESFGKSEMELKDGMDISLCALDHNSLTLQWAGANNPLYILPADDKAARKFPKETRLFSINENDESKLYELKPDKQPVGRHSQESGFTNHSIQLVPGDLICLFSDGFADQFGGPRGKKLKQKTFKEALIQVKNLSSREQLNTLEHLFTSWKGNYEQVDDVCVMGVRV